MPKARGKKPFSMAQLVEKVRTLVDGDMQKPLVVSVMGQTGVGKSSLINALFSTHLPTDPVNPGTVEVEPVSIHGKSGHEVIFRDLPGVGESAKGDQKWIPQYRSHLQESDVAIWAVLAESRSFRYDLDMLNMFINDLKEDEKIKLLSKIVFVLTKVDSLTDPGTPVHWALARDKDEGFFVPDLALENLIKRKEDYFRDKFIAPFKPLIRSQTYYNRGGSLNGQIPHLHNNEGIVYYDDFLEEETFQELSHKYPRYKEMFRRLYDGYRVIPCSAHLRYNLDLLMNVIISKLNTNSAGRFKGFVEEKPMDRMPYEKARHYPNIVIVNLEDR